MSRRDGDQPCEHLGCLKAPSDALGPMGRAGPPGARRLLLLSTHLFIKEKKICSSVSAKVPLVLSTIFPGKLEHRGLLFFK